MTEVVVSPKTQNPMKSLKLIGLSASLAVLCVLQARAQLPTIGVQFLGRDGSLATTGPGVPALLQSDVAGVIPQAGWNAVDDSTDPTLGGPGGGGVVPSLGDSNLVTTAVSLVYDANDAWYDDVAPSALTKPNAQLLNGIIKSNGGDGKTESFLFTNVPEGQYDLYVYTTMNGDGVWADVADSDSTETFYITEWHQFYDTNTFVRASNTDPKGVRDTGNYVKLSNLGTYGRGTIGAVVTRRGTAADGTGVPALQLVGVGPALPSVKPSVLLSPTNSTIAEGTGISYGTRYGINFAGTPTFNIQWYTNGVAIAGQTNLAFSLSPIWFAQNGLQVTFSVSNTLGGFVSAPGTVTVIQDLGKPTLVSSSTSDDFAHASIVFSKPLLQSSAETLANYSFNNGLTISAAKLTSANTVTLTTSAQTPGATYTLTVNNVKDQTTAGNTIAANSTIDVVADVIANGICEAYYFNNIGGGTAVSALTGAASYTNNLPDVIHYHAGLDASESYINGNVDNYGAKVFGWIIPTVSGNYDFFLRSDDASQLFLSTDSTAAHLSAAPIAEETGCCNPFEETGASHAQTTAAPITLVGGQKYYFVALLKEGGGGDYVQVAMRQDTDTTPAANLHPISGPNLAAAVSPVGAVVTITQQPVPTTAEANEPITFTVKATGSSVLGTAVLYQWQRNGTPISGANSSSYTIVNPTVAGDSGAQFNVVVTVPGKSVTSDTVALTVVPDTNPLQASVSTITASDGTVQVGVSFDEPADVTTLVPANFSLTGGTITAFKVATNSFQTYGSVILATTGLTKGNTYTLHISNVKDPQGNTTTTNVSFSVGGISWAETGTQIAPGQVIPVGTNGFDILNGGRQEWGSYDEIDMAYVIKTNDFDVRVEVVYAEPGSQWTRVGLQARNDMNVGEPNTDRSSATSAASAYAQTHVNPAQTLGSSGAWDPADPVQTVNNTPNNGHEQNQRATRGGATAGWGNASTPPPYPTAWIRLTRSGTVLHGYRSSDGVNWDDQGTFSLTDQQNFMYVGPFLGVETGNIFSGSLSAGTGFDVWGDAFNPKYDRLFVAQFRNFGDTPTVVTTPTISISAGPPTSITFTGTLMQSTNLGPTAVWSAVTGAASPYTVPVASKPALFIRTQ